MLAAGYDESKLHLTEMGWPYEGDDYEGNSPSYDGMQQYLDDRATWSSSVQSSYWFMMYDTTVIYTGANYETHFGVFGDMVAHVTIPGGSSSSTGTTSSTTTDDSTQQQTTQSSASTVADDSTQQQTVTESSASTTADDSTQQQTVTEASASQETETVTSAPTSVDASAEEDDSTVSATDSPSVTPAATTSTTSTTTTTANCAVVGRHWPLNFEEERETLDGEENRMHFTLPR
ncbi:hypothetical protein PF003_g29102 [Phytophthora fragariae]|nr:hypothetical protein PF003_g29102 [Phytophthora fragariae]